MRRTTLITEPDPAWDIAWQWLIRQRRHHPPDALVWDLRWKDLTQPGFRLQRYRQVIAGQYRLKPMRILYRRDGSSLPVRDAEDALVLKWVALKLQHYLPLHPSCTHTAGYGGLYRAREQAEFILSRSDYRYLYRTDIQGYYRHISHGDVNELFQRYITDPLLYDLAWQSVTGLIEDGGTFFTPQGLCRANSLSPLIGSALLYGMDEKLSAKATNGQFYVRFMDDMLLVTRTRWALRNGRRCMMEYLARHGMTVHPDKTQVGSLPGTCFTWLGYEYATGPEAGQWQKARLQRSGQKKSFI